MLKTTIPQLHNQPWEVNDVCLDLVLRLLSENHPNMTSQVSGDWAKFAAHQNQPKIPHLNTMYEITKLLKSAINERLFGTRVIHKFYF